MGVRDLRIGLASLAALWAATAACAEPSPIDATEVDVTVTKALAAWDVPGAAVAIVTRENVLVLRGYGKCELGTDRPLTPETIFPLASCTKAFTSTALAMLADERTIGWDDRVQKHLPEFRLADPLANAEVTLRDLLTHRTGVAPHDFLWYRSPLAQADLVRRVGLLPLEHSFRSTFQYQSMMYTAAGFAAGRAGGSTWQNLVKKRIFEPLGMSTATTTTPDQVDNLATPHRAGRDGRLQKIDWYRQSEANPAGSVHCSARDLAGWLQFQIGDGTFRGRRLVSAANLAETHTPQIVLRLDGLAKEANPDTVQMSYGFGWVIQDYRGHLLVSHAGMIDGLRVHLTLMPQDGFALAILSNRHQTRMNQALSNILVDRLLGLTVKDWHSHFQAIRDKEEQAARDIRQQRELKRQRGTKPSRPLNDYVGVYDHPAYGRATVSMRDGCLYWEWSGYRGPLDHYQLDTFSLEDEVLPDPMIAFQVTPQSGVAGFTFLNLPFKRSTKEPLAAMRQAASGDEFR